MTHGNTIPYILEVMEIEVLGNIYDSDNITHANGRVYSGGGIAPTLGASNFGTEKWIFECKKVGQDGKLKPEEGSLR